LAVKKNNLKMKEKTKGAVWAFEYCDCIHESAFVTLSLHFTEEGAKKAMRKHRKIMKKRFNEYQKYHNSEPGLPESCKVKNSHFGRNEDWRVISMEVEE
jgi:hypothetical protein